MGISFQFHTLMYKKTVLLVDINTHKRRVNLDFVQSRKLCIKSTISWYVYTIMKKSGLCIHVHVTVNDSEYLATLKHRSSDSWEAYNYAKSVTVGPSLYIMAHEIEEQKQGMLTGACFSLSPPRMRHRDKIICFLLAAGHSCELIFQNLGNQILEKTKHVCMCGHPW